jgi:hypothetical protein
VSEHENQSPYGNTREHLLEELVRVELLLRRHVESLWSDPGGRADDGGFYVSDGEVDRLLATGPEVEIGAHHEGYRSPSAGSETAETTEQLEAVTRSVRERASLSIDRDVDLRLIALAREFELSPLEVDVLLLALAPDLDRKFETVYGYLRDDITKTRPTVGLLLGVLAHSEPERLSLLGVFADRSTLAGDGLIEVVDGPTVPSSDVRVRRRVIEYLLGSDAVADALADAATVVDPSDGGDAPRETLGDLAIDDDVRRTLREVAGRLGSRNRSETGDALCDLIPASDSDQSGSAADESAGDREDESFGPHGAETPIFAAFVGPDERTAEAAVVGVCAEVGTPILRVDGRSLSPDGLEADLAVVRREARLQGAAIHVTSVGALESDGPPRSSAASEASAEPMDGRRVDDGLRRLVLGLDSFTGDVFVSGDAPVSARLQPRLDGHAFRRVEFPRPGFEARRTLWNAVEDLPVDADPGTLAGTFRLTRGEIEDAVSTARSLSDGALTAPAIREACRIHSRQDLDDLATEIEPTYGWEDIVLPDDTLAHLREVAAGIRHRGTVYEEWGFADRFSLGNGINVLFTGPSGTGKTMAAEIIAGDVGLPLYKLDLARILSKYIGETEKNLGRIFDAAEHSNAILFFDEADALFGTRTEISDSHDRYANVEVDYLLQRMEEHDGCVVMASNLKENIDDAFRRRINATVDFSLPDADARAEIWRTIFPEEMPRGDLDVEFLAEFELSGGYIKNVALTAAFMAAEDGEELGMGHVVRALRREFQKTGRLLDLDEFGEYRRLVE